MTDSQGTPATKRTGTVRRQVPHQLGQLQFSSRTQFQRNALVVQAYPHHSLRQVPKAQADEGQGVSSATLQQQQQSLTATATYTTVSKSDACKHGVRLSYERILKCGYV